MTKNGKITLAILATKLDYQTDVLQKLIGEFEKHVKEDRQVSLIVDRLNQSEQRREWHIKALWSSIIAGIVGWIVRLFFTSAG